MPPFAWAELQPILQARPTPASRGSQKMSTNGQRQSNTPILKWLFAYQKSFLPYDVIAGLVTAAVVIPKAMAYATIAGLPVQVGLYTALVPMVIYALIGTSLPLSVSTTTTLAILAGAEFSQVVPNGDPASLMTASATLTLLVGAILVLASLLRLGFIANFISEPVLIGFKAGIALVIVLDQVPKLLGIHFPKSGFFRNLLAIVRGNPRNVNANAGGRSSHDRAVVRPGAVSPPGARAVDRGGCRYRRYEPSWIAEPRCSVSRPHPTGPAVFHLSRLLPPGAALAWRLRNRADELHRDDRCRAGLC